MNLGFQIKLSIEWKGMVGINSLAPISSDGNDTLNPLTDEELAKIKYLDITGRVYK